MSSDRQIAIGALGLVVLVAAMAWLFIYPGYREAAAFRREVTNLKNKIAGLSTQNNQVVKLAERVEEARARVGSDCKIIPESPEIAELIRKLSLPVDGASVVDQTFTAGSPDEIPVGDKATVKSMPLKVEMNATFDSIFALLRSAESVNRLVRVTSVKVICKRDEKAPGAEARVVADLAPLLNASVGLEAIYDPATLQEGH